MKYFLRYTENAEKDLDRGFSVHNSDYRVGDVAGWDDEDERSEQEILAEKWGCDVDDIVIIDGYYSQELAGLCAFELEAETEEEAKEEAADYYYNEVYNNENFANYAIFEGAYVEDCPEGCVMIPKRIIK